MSEDDIDFEMEIADEYIPEGDFWGPVCMCGRACACVCRGGARCWIMCSRLAKGWQCRCTLDVPNLGRSHRTSEWPGSWSIETINPELI